MAKLVFMGTPEFAVPTLRSLIQHHEVIGVITQPDRPAGRGNSIQASPIKQAAQAAGIPVLQPEKIRRADAIDALRQWPADAYVVAAFGQILPQTVLDIPQHGSINVHASLLPRWRGAAPIHAAIRAGDTRTGITIMKMDAGLDTGPMLSQAVLEIDDDQTTEGLHDQLAQLGADLLIQTLPGYLSGAIEPKPQPEEGVTYAPQIRKDDGRIDWTRDAHEIERLVRAFTSWPGTFTFWGGTQIKILAGDVLEVRDVAAPGQVIEVAGRIAVGTGFLLYALRQVQLAGRKPASIADFARGYPDFIGAALG
jgi:methionyl-tRNA formyltransferase